MKNDVWKTFSDAAALQRVEVRLIKHDELTKWNELVDKHHYLKSNFGGPALRYVAELGDEWVGLIGFGVAAYHLKHRDEWIGWNDAQRYRRLNFIAQNKRFVLLHSSGEFPNLASRIMSLCCTRVSEDWQNKFGNPIVALETFVDAAYFTGGCYKASGWERLGLSKGYKVSKKDYYQKHDRPKEIWVKMLNRRFFRSLKSRQLPKQLREHEKELKSCPFQLTATGSLFDLFNSVPDNRRKQAMKYRLSTILSLIALAVLCGQQGSRGITSFAKKLTQRQRKQLRCYYDRKKGEYIVPSETTIRRILYSAKAECIEDVISKWIEQLDPLELQNIAIDGKTLKGTGKRDEKGEKKGMLHLVGAVGHANSRMVAQQPVAQKTNEITAAEQLIERIASLDGKVITADAMHTNQNMARLIVQKKGAIIAFD